MKLKIKLGLMTFFTLSILSSSNFASSYETQNYNYGSSSSPMLKFKNERLDLLGETIVKRAKSTIKRYEDRVDVSINTRELPPGAYTVWMITFDNPEACSDFDCGEDDIFLDMLTADRRLNWDQIEAAQISVFWVTGGIAGDDGRAYFSKTVDIGNLPGAINLGPSDGNYFENPQGADIMFQVRYHGYAAWDMPEQLGLQISTFKGYCDQFNQDNLNLKGQPVGCYEPQFTMHSNRNEMGFHLHH